MSVINRYIQFAEQHRLEAAGKLESQKATLQIKGNVGSLDVGVKKHPIRRQGLRFELDEDGRNIIQAMRQVRIAAESRYFYT